MEESADVRADVMRNSARELPPSSRETPTSARLLLTRSESHKAAVRASGLELFSGFSLVQLSELGELLSEP